MLPDGVRLHLHHGPIDLIVEANAAARVQAYALAVARFETVLDELVAELPALRAPSGSQALNGAIAQNMLAATQPLNARFITPMASVAGAVADEICAAMSNAQPRKAYVNNGGDTAFHLEGAEQIRAAAPWGKIALRHIDPWRGIASSGWRGRSHSLGIADCVTVVARNAARADAAATLIANAIDLPDHPAITRIPARQLWPDSDLGDRLVTTDVGPLSHADVDRALGAGARYAEALLSKGLIGAACLTLCGQTHSLGADDVLQLPEALDA